MQKLSVLIVDDESLARDLVKTYLQDIPDIQIVGECENGFEALNSIQKNKPDLVFLDVVMPEMDGIETLRRIKAHDKNLDIIMVSAINRAQEATDSIRPGADDY
ncbi:MAG: response regulator, partial [Bacteroidetes bacterium]|nr:response regulator [Bacteroidota bacterium]